jgi:hypothetical protein
LQPSRWLPAALLTLGLSPFAVAAFPDDPEILHIGLVDALVKDLSPGRKSLLAKDFPDLVLEFTGLKSQTIQGDGPFDAARKLAEGKWHLTVLPGVEFAWAQAKDPKLRPLLLAINQQRAVHALLVAKKDSPLTGFADLKGKAVHLLKSREHCQLFTDKSAGGKPQEFFGKVVPAKNVEDALDNVLRGKVQAAVVDNVDLDVYKSIHPGRYDRVKVLAKSEPFPATVIAYYQGALSEGILKKLRAGMLKANESEKGKEAMADVRITAFEAVPEDFSQLLSSIAKAYPAPAK